MEMFPAPRWGSRQNIRQALLYSKCSPNKGLLERMLGVVQHLDLEHGSSLIFQPTKYSTATMIRLLSLLPHSPFQETLPIFREEKKNL